jgi:hypothetical protein
MQATSCIQGDKQQRTVQNILYLHSMAQAALLHNREHAKQHMPLGIQMKPSTPSKPANALFMRVCKGTSVLAASHAPFQYCRSSHYQQRCTDTHTC